MSDQSWPYLQLDNGDQITIKVRGYQLMNRPMLNRGTAFTHEERQALGLVGLLPPGSATLESQLRRVYRQYQAQRDDLAKNVFLTQMRERNEVLFYRLLAEHIDEMLPIVYTPTIGKAIEVYSDWYSRPRGVYLSIDRPDEMEESLKNYGLGADEVDIVVVTDSEGILGIGDQGVGGISITTGKLSVYTAAAGIHPRRCVPVVLDVGTDNLRLLNSENYLGERHSRVRGERYDEFIDQFVAMVTRLYPGALLHWEDFAAANAHRILAKYRDQCCTFNDDIQGTAAVVLAAAMAGVHRAGSRMRDQRIVVFGAGSAGIGIADAMRDALVADGLTVAEANRRFWCIDRDGLILGSMGESVRDFQQPYARTDGDVEGWDREAGRITLAEVVRRIHPSILIGTSAQTGAFTEEIVRSMAAGVDRPVIFPLSNPTSRAEATPADLLAWTHGKALIATGSPFEPVLHAGVRHRIAQANNALVFPGLGLGVAVSKASRVSDQMVQASARAVAAMATDTKPGAPLLPPVDQLRTVSASVAVEVCRAAASEGLARVDLADPVQQVFQAMWQPVYAKVVIP